MPHQVRQLADGFDCVCGYHPRYRRDADPAQIRADMDAHLNKKRPSKSEITDLITALQDWQRQLNAATTVPAGEPMGMFKMVPNPPQDLVDRVGEVARAFEWVSFPVLTQFARDPGGPHIKDVVMELASARNVA
jgi:hypothetical protein